ncbi:Protein translocase subunit SecE [hydrothermal vent metagenome]|uniref:Protein translocase subunit SecE n=1 Tax=hydrothermal vent metagenome TaxID=652676 RepID=A0A3B0ZWI3_9ZZZZ
MDKIKFAIVLALVVAGIYGFYHYADEAFLFRVLGLLAIIAVAFGIAVTTQAGTNGVNFGRAAVVEMRKTVWPTKKETMQTTGIVIVMVIIMGLVLWLFDTILVSIIRWLTS